MNNKLYSIMIVFILLTSISSSFITFSPNVSATEDVEIARSLVTESIAGRKYTPECFSECHMVLNLTINSDNLPSLLNLVYANFTFEYEDKINDDIILDSISVLKNDTFTEEQPTYDIIDYNETYEINNTLPGNEDDSNSTHYWYYSTKQEQNGTTEVDKWRYLWKDVTQIPIPKNEPVIVDLKFSRTPSIGIKSVDVVPTVIGVSMPEFAWFNSSWDNRFLITINSSEVDSDLTDFPVFFNLSDAPSEFWSSVDTDGDDIVVTQGEDVQVPRELVHIDTTNEHGELWFKGNLTSATDTEFYLYYNNPSATETNDPDTWRSEYLAVYHLNQDTTAGSCGDGDDLCDSTSNGNNGTFENAGADKRMPGQIYNGSSFDGGDDNINVGSGSSIDNVLSSGATISGWIDTRSDGQANEGRILDKGTFWRWYTVSESGGSVKIRFATDFDSTDGIWTTSSTDVTLNQKTYVVLTYSNSLTTNDPIMYIDGDSKSITEDSTPVGSALNDASGSLILGNSPSTAMTFDGILDELRIYDDIITADWIAAEYSNQNTPTTFYTTASQESDSSETLSITLNSPTDTATLTDTTPDFDFTPQNLNSTLIFTQAELFINDTGYGLNSSALVNNTAEIITANDTLTPGGYEWYINLTDNSSTTVKSDVRTFTLDTPPTWSNQGQNATQIDSGSIPIKLFAQGLDVTGLDWAVLSTNETGEFENKTNNNAAWNISFLDFVRDYDVSTQGADPEGVFLKPDGLVSYILDNQKTTINEYQLSINWNISSSSISQNKNISLTSPNPTDIFLKSDGTVAYISDRTGEINQYTLSDPWNISTASFNHSFTLTNPMSPDPKGIFLGNDGLKLYISDSDESLYEYDLSDPWNISTASFIQSVSISSKNPSPEGVFLKSDGTLLYTIGLDQEVDQYTLSDPWNISTMLYDRSFSLSNKDSNPSGMFLKNTGTKFFFVGNTNNKVYEYNIINPNSIDSRELFSTKLITWSNFTWTNSSITDRRVVGWKIYFNDTSGNSNVTDTLTFSIGSPKWYDNTSTIQGVGQATSVFNVTWNDTPDFSIDTVFIEHNGTGTLTNYSMSLVDIQNATLNYGVYQYSNSFNAGNFTWKSYTNASDGAWNSTEYENFEVTFTEIYDTHTFTQEPITVENSEHRTVNANFIGTGTANYTSLPEGYTNLTVINSSSDSISFNNGTTWVSFTAEQAQSNYTIGYNSIPFTKVDSDGLSCPAGYTKTAASGENFCRKSTTGADRINYFFLLYTNGTDGNTTDYQIDHNITSSIFTSFSSRIVDTRAVNSSSINVSESSSGGNLLISVGTNYDSGSLGAGIWEYQYDYHTLTSAPPAGGGGGGGGGGGSTTQTCGNGIQDPSETRESCPKDFADLEFFAVPETSNSVFIKGKTNTQEIILRNPNPEELKIIVGWTTEQSFVADWVTYGVKTDTGGIVAATELNEDGFVIVDGGTESSPGTATVVFEINIPEDAVEPASGYEIRFEFDGSESDASTIPAFHTITRSIGLSLPTLLFSAAQNFAFKTFEVGKLKIKGWMIQAAVFVLIVAVIATTYALSGTKASKKFKKRIKTSTRKIRRRFQ